ncbi:MAG: DUF3857 domain-containing protein [Acidobacteriales bacterium]|nr:DUF3857 domain-containing protein [Terriglobales bacterium]
MYAVRIKATFWLVLSLCILPAVSAAEAPDWLRSLAREPLGTYPKETEAVALLDDERTTVKDNGEIVTFYRRAYKILRPGGESVTRLSVEFSEDKKLTYLKGWSITPEGHEYEAKEKDAIETSGFDSSELYSDVKYKILKLPGGQVGTVVGFEYERKRQPYTFENTWFIHSSLPTKHSRFTLRIPAGWEYKTAWVNHAAQEPKVIAGEHIWELNDLPAIEDEPRMPHWRAVTGRMTITFFSPKVQGRTYSSWAELGTWYTQLTSGRRDLTPAIQEQAKKLTATSPDGIPKIRALASYVQARVRYVAIEIGIGGLRPHPADTVLTRSYGDCKDKATLLSSLLKAVGIESYYVPVHTERGVFTEKTSPSIGFNHVILAIALPPGSESKGLDAVLTHPRLGKLLFFDPTAEFTPLGSLPPYEQDNYALLVTPSGGEFVKLPGLGAESNRLQRTAKLTLLPDGTLKGTVEEVRTGDAAGTSRFRLRSLTAADHRKSMENFLSQLLGSFQLDDVTAENLETTDRELVLRYSFTASRYAKTMGPLLLVRPRVLGEKAGVLENKPRKYAYEFDSASVQTDVFEITLPAGYQIDELPDPAEVKFPFAEYSSKIEAASNVLKYRREYRVKEPLVPAEKIAELQRLFSEINNDERNVAVLKKSN